MTGIQNFKKLPVIGIYLIFGFSLTLDADVITLECADAKLSGTVHSINEFGVVKLVSEISPELLSLKSEAITRINFSGNESSPLPPPVLIELVNGDLLPITIESLDEQKLIALSSDAGQLEIPREFLKSMQIGIQKRKLLYSGPKPSDEWISPNNEKKWEFEQGGFVSKKSASASKKFKLPEQFILRFTLMWEENQTPNFKIFFADPLLGLGQPVDRYYIQLASAGLELKRESSEGKRYSTMKQINRIPNKILNHQLKVEMRVNRKTSRIRLFLNDEEEGLIADSFPNAPNGSGITFECNAMNGAEQRIQNIEILEYNEARARHSPEEHKDKKHDSLISTEDDRWIGNLTSIQKAITGMVFKFKCDSQNELLNIPETNVSTVFFATTDEPKTNINTNPIILLLQNDGTLHVSSCQLNDKSAVVSHSLLGNLNIKRTGIISLEKSQALTNNQSNP